ncbi:1,2-phenylacetyl-CoA epoxidase subunit PaaD [Aridibaculum aurantiacum]|uniref:1,2-phenylacetyl-CoA epoxidase subunit PaaD n=1 Tax=Aridibaculum aurantiacum TaxID=2810307 RepID=UPI001A974E79|nr:1,2-phenylacetyl-CoA epoxidase subunit PaaD [Aridibaculum aurantiacum]
MNRRTNNSPGSANAEVVKQLWEILEEVPDPEVPVLSVVDLGVVRNVSVVQLNDEEHVVIDITPTYSGCPAMDMIAMNIRMTLLQHGFVNVKLNTILSPAWTTDWMSENGKQKLKAFGIAPPAGKALDQAFLETLQVECPLCHSTDTKLVSQFGSTSCKALFQCNDCKEPFDHFKCH